MFRGELSHDIIRNWFFVQEELRDNFRWKFRWREYLRENPQFQRQIKRSTLPPFRRGNAILDLSPSRENSLVSSGGP